MRALKSLQREEGLLLGVLRSPGGQMSQRAQAVGAMLLLTARASLSTARTRCRPAAEGASYSRNRSGRADLTYPTMAGGIFRMSPWERPPVRLASSSTAMARMERPRWSWCQAVAPASPLRCGQQFRGWSHNRKASRAWATSTPAFMSSVTCNHGTQGSTT
jgi:hypothetical protein